jgi:hypothetical protein
MATVAGRGVGSALVSAVGSAGTNELSIYWPGIRTAKMERTAGRRIFFREKGLRRARAGRPPESIKRFSSYTPRRMFRRILVSFFPLKMEIMAFREINKS